MLGVLYSLHGQEFPPIQNYKPVDYAAGNQNWALSQGENNYIYSANNNGLLEFNGAIWKYYSSLYGTPITSVKAIGEHVYTGSYMEFGRWSTDAFGNLKYDSISDKLKLPLVEDEQFWNITHFKDWVLFQSLDRIYIYHTTNETFDVVEAKTTKADIFKVGNNIYYQIIDEGLYAIENGVSVLVSDSKILKEDIIIGVFSVDENTLIVTEQGEFYKLTSNGLIRWKVKADLALSSTKVYSSLQLRNGTLVLGTISNGMFHIDEKGNVIRNINQETGLNNNTVLAAFQDNDDNLWLGLDNGISVINLDSPFQEYIDEVGKLGVVYTSIQVDDLVYLGTNQGLFFKDEKTENAYQLIENTAGQVWILKEINGTLFCGHNSGTFVVEENRASKIASFPGTWDIKPIPNKPNLLLQGNFEGLSVLQRIDNEWQLRNKIEGFDSSSRFFEFVGTRQVIVNHEYKGIFDLKIDAEFQKVLALNKMESKGMGSSLVTFNNHIVYTNFNGVFEYDNNDHEFKIDTVLTSKFFGHKDDIIGVPTADIKNGRLWAFTKENIVYIEQAKFNGELQATKIPIPKYLVNSFGKSGFENITHLRDEQYLIGISNGYITLDLDKWRTKEFHIDLNGVSKEFYDADEEFMPLRGNDIFNYADNNLNFKYSVPEYNKFTEVSYQYRLVGQHDDWSAWFSEPEVSFKNLPYGKYAFKVRAKAGNKLTNNIATYDFEVARPWYLSNVAVVLYVLSLVLISVLIHKLYKAYYKNQREQILKESKKKLKRKKLKAQKKLVQLNNEKLKEEVDSKNRELAISTMSIIKKNEFLNAIKDELKDHSDNSQIKAVIRTIDRNINNSDDWKFFEDAFNNADKDFLKKIKNIHQELTPNDLRLCAYLRLNLSSKEIAPLLNISVRSVEVKRYRLRKKMHLPHEVGLTDYIMSI